MKTAGEVLKEAREINKKTIGQVARETKIKERFLEALETSNYALLPNSSVAQGFAKSFAQAVGADPKVIAAFLRRDFPNKNVVTKSTEMPVIKQSIWTPRTTFFVAIAATIFILTLYLARQYTLFVGAPPLEIEKVVAGPEGVLVIGKTIPTATVQVNKKAIIVDDQGNFQTELMRDEVNGFVEIHAVSRTGKETVIRKTVDAK